MKQSLVYRLVICPEVPPLVVDCIIASLDSTLYSGKLHYLLIFSLAFSLSLSLCLCLLHSVGMLRPSISLIPYIFLCLLFLLPFLFLQPLSLLLYLFLTLSHAQSLLHSLFLSLSLACSEPFALSLHHRLYR